VWFPGGVKLPLAGKANQHAQADKLLMGLSSGQVVALAPGMDQRHNVREDDGVTFEGRV
jgi:hypothetical protein